MSPRTAYLRAIRVVANLHFVPPEMPLYRGFGLIEALVALVVLGVAATGVVAVSGAGRQLREIAAVRTAQVLAARAAVDAIDGRRAWLAVDTVQVGKRRLEVTIDTLRVAAGLLEVRISVEGSGPAARYEMVTRRADAWR